jgi:ribonuclease D
VEKTSEVKNSPEYTYVDSAQGLARLTPKLQNAARVSMDTEADGLHRYAAQVCLIQLSFSGENFIVDPLAGFSLTDFFEALSQKELIFQGADYDLRILKKSFGFRPQAPVFDTMLAAQVLGYEKIGLAAQAEAFAGVVLSKCGQKADWSQRPLPERLLAYASDDTKYLETIAAAMTQKLQDLNRLDWHRECCQRVVKISGLPDKNENKETWRVKGSSKMAPEELVFLREIWKWREEEARRRDRPPFHILQNENLVELAVWRAKNPQMPLREGPFFLKRISADSFARLESALRFAQNIPQAKWPLPLPKREWDPERPDKKLEKLLAACKALATELKIESSFLASRAALTAVAKAQPRSIEAAMESGGLMRWQAELLMPALERLAA